jgi:uncharacterized protein YyaL (SSP411 family)
MTDLHSRPNRLAAETSPYLRQHQYNPVDWYAWGTEALTAARELNRPIFLSVGYSTCYWCHVMERQCFENPDIAAQMNERFVCIKVDREERPDVDQLYMTAVQLLTRQGGWPMSVFLTPDLRPFYAGTYFPPTDQYGRPGFPTLLRALDDAWKTRAGDVNSTGDQLVGVLRKLAEPAAPEREMSIDDSFITRLIERSISDYDSRNGGFGAAPKFPRQTLLELLLTYAAPERGTSPLADRVRAMVLHTLDSLARGGIRDHLGGGFHRYSTDAQWLVPHFEIMLYDNAMLAWCYVEAFRQTRDPRWWHVARGIFDFVLREMTSPQGAFYTAFDAEVDAMEGASYLWTREEVLEIFRHRPASIDGGGLNDAEIFCLVYGLDDGPNFADPHHGNGTPDKNILYLPRPVEDVAAELKIDSEMLADRLEMSRQALLAARSARKQPLLDTKILTSWNALMIRAFAHGGTVLERPEYTAAAERAAAFLLDRHASDDGGLLRASGGFATDQVVGRSIFPSPGTPGEGQGGGQKSQGTPVPDMHSTATSPPPQPSPGVPGEGENAAATAPPETSRPNKRSPIPGFLDDYAFLAQALLALGQKWEPEANRIIEQMLERFGDRNVNRGFFFTELAAKDLIVRQKTGTDSPLPSGNGVAAAILHATGRTDAAAGTLAAFAASMEAQGESMSAMINAALAYVDRVGPFTVEPASEADQANRPASPQELAERIVAIKASRKSPKLLEVELTIQPGWHLNAHDVDGAVPLIATSLKVARDDATITYPPGEERKFEFAGNPLRVYSGRVVIGLQFAREVHPDESVQLTLSYQACDDSTCLPPVNKRIVLNG